SRCTCGRNLPHSLHVDLPPWHRIGTDPHIFVAFGDPESVAASEDRRRALDVAMQPVGMILGERVLGFISVWSDALGAGDINESMVAGLVGLPGKGPDGIQFLGGIDETVVSAGDIIVDLNA